MRAIDWAVFCLLAYAAPRCQTVNPFAFSNMFTCGILWPRHGKTIWGFARVEAPRNPTTLSRVQVGFWCILGLWFLDHFGSILQSFTVPICHHLSPSVAIYNLWGCLAQASQWSPVKVLEVETLSPRHGEAGPRPCCAAGFQDHHRTVSHPQHSAHCVSHTRGTTASNSTCRPGPRITMNHVECFPTFSSL